MTETFRKLNYKGQDPILILGAPSSFSAELDAMAGEARVDLKPRPGLAYGFALGFATRMEDFQKLAALLGAATSPEAPLWIAYPKKSSKSLASDLDRDLCREAAAGFGLKTVRQIAIDEDWSALRYARTTPFA
jgi:hypothetical protein